MVAYQPIGDDADELFYDYMQYGFNPEDGPVEYDPDDVRRPVGDRRGLYVDGEDTPVCICRHYWLDALVRGRTHPIAGLTSVITPPEHRRGGHVSQLLLDALVEYRDRSRHLAVLWPFDYGFYNTFGWETANDRVVYTCTPDALAFTTDSTPANGTYRRVEPSDPDILDSVYETHAGAYSLSLERSEEWWRHRVFRDRGDAEPFAYAWFRDGVPQAYLVYSFDGHRDRTMTVHEYAYVDDTALAAILAFCYNHDSQVATVELQGPDDTVLRDLFDAPDDVTVERHTGPMVRVVDVAEVLSALAYPAVDAAMTVSVHDSVAEWNDRTFSLVVDDGRCSCRPTDDIPDVHLDVATLAQLVVGYRTASALKRAGRIEAQNSDVVATLDALFPRERVFFRDGF